MRGKHPNSQDNLKPFKKGESGNPSGRMKAFSGIKDDLKAYVNADDYCSIDLTNRDIIVQEIVGMAKNGEWRAIELLEKLGCLD